jgi:hypothetical protein
MCLVEVVCSTLLVKDPTGKVHTHIAVRKPASLSAAHLPKSQEHHSLHQHKLQKGVEGLQQFRCSIPEQDEAIECQRVANVVQDGDVKVPAATTT